MLYARPINEPQKQNQNKNQVRRACVCGLYLNVLQTHDMQRVPHSMATFQCKQNRHLAAGVQVKTIGKH